MMSSHSEGTKRTITTGGDAWEALAADPYYNPSPANISVPGIDAETAYAKILEQTDARREVVGWRTVATTAPAWAAAVPSFYQASDQLIARMERPLQVYAVPPPTVTATKTSNPGNHNNAYFVDFHREFQGGVVIRVGGSGDDTGEAGTASYAGTRLRIISGELLLPNGTIDASTSSRIASSNTWGYAFNWTLRDGAFLVPRACYCFRVHATARV